jgi:hypothetical protein
MLSSLKSKFFKSIKSKKLNVFVFFLVLSFLFLVFAKLSKTYTETIVFYVKYDNVPEQHSISSDHDSIIKVRVKAYGFNLLSHNFFKHSMDVNFKKDTRKRGEVYIWDTKKGFSKISSTLGSKFEILSVEPDSLVFPYEIMTVKTVPVKLDVQISYSAGYDLLDSLILQPDSVKVIGPKNIVEKISRIKTATKKLKDVHVSIDETLELIQDKSLKDIKLDKNSVKLTGTVEKFTEGTFEVPVTIVNLPSDIKINYFPKTVFVSYYVSLENYKKIKALDFEIVCDYAQLESRDGTFFIPQLVSKPKLVRSAKIKQNKVEFIIIE